MAKLSNDDGDDVAGLWRVSARHLCAGIIVRDGEVVEAAPILRWMIGSPLREIADYCSRRGWKLERLAKPCLLLLFYP